MSRPLHILGTCSPRPLRIDGPAGCIRFFYMINTQTTSRQNKLLKSTTQKSTVRYVNGRNAPNRPSDLVLRVSYELAKESVYKVDMCADRERQ